MPWFDIVIIIIIAGFALFGLFFGLVHTLGSLIGTILGVFLASRWYAPFADWLLHFTGWSSNLAKVIMFVIVFIIINRLIGFAFFLVDKILSIFTRLPFINGLNRLLGLVFGFAEGVIVVGITFYFISRFPLSVGFMTAAQNSKIVPLCTAVAAVLWPLVPGAIRSLQNALASIIH